MLFFVFVSVLLILTTTTCTLGMHYQALIIAATREECRGLFSLPLSALLPLWKHLRNGVHEERDQILVLTLNIRNYICATSLCVWCSCCHQRESLQLRLKGQALYNFRRFYCWKKHGADRFSYWLCFQCVIFTSIPCTCEEKAEVQPGELYCSAHWFWGAWDMGREGGMLCSCRTGVTA